MFHPRSGTGSVSFSWTPSDLTSALAPRFTNAQIYLSYAAPNSPIAPGQFRTRTNLISVTPSSFPIYFPTPISWSANSIAGTSTPSANDGMYVAVHLDYQRNC